MNRSVASAFEGRERRAWGVEVSLVELMKQVGDLARAVMSIEHYYLEDRDEKPAYAPDRARIADEIADILYCVMRIADHYDVDIENAHVAARTAEWASLRPGTPPPWQG
jgi:NTP pyrophosphatase (non-canonical NTP hydrolase)